jgi:FkbM family methyltransferase
MFNHGKGTSMNAVNLVLPLKQKAKRLIGSAIMSLAKASNIDLLDLAYIQKELCICDIGELEFLHFVLAPILKGLDDPVLLDVGANRGDYTQWLHETFPNAIIFGFEPNPNTFEIYQERFCEMDNIRPVNLALGDKSETWEIYTYEGDLSSGHASLNKEVLSLTGLKLISLPCQMDTLDSLVREIPELGCASFIKLDVEGYELKALTGAKNILKSRSLKAIQFEFNSMNIHTKTFLKNFYDLLWPEFSFFRLTSTGMDPLGNYSAKNELFTYQNIVVVRSESASLCPPIWKSKQK